MKPKILSLNQLLAKKYRFLENLPENILASFGQLTMNFIMIIYGDSGNGKSNLIMQLVKLLINHGKILYISLEEGHEVSMQLTALRQLSAEHHGVIGFADDSMTFDELVKYLKKKRSAQFIIIDSVQYFDIDYKKYKLLKLWFKNKTFIFISHAKGKKPDGFTACKIEYDAAIKVRVHGLIAFIKSRLGGNAPYVIWEEGAKNFWGNKYKTFFKKPKKAVAPKQPAEEKQKEEITA
jgi:hypothetical protein